MAQRTVYDCDNCGKDMEAHPSQMIFYMVAGRREPGPVESEQVNPLVEAMNLLRVPRVELCQDCAMAMMSAAPQLIDRLAAKAVEEQPTDKELPERATMVRARARAFRDEVRERLNAAAAERRNDDEGTANRSDRRA